jgi:hypothetical protein
MSKRCIAYYTSCSESINNTKNRRVTEEGYGRVGTQTGLIPPTYYKGGSFDQNDRLFVINPNAFALRVQVISPSITTLKEVLGAS